MSGTILAKPLTPAEAMLTGRTRAWGALCIAGAAGVPATWPAMLGTAGDRRDIEAMVDRLETACLAERCEDGVRLTARGLEAAAETRRIGGCPAIVQDDPHDWYQRAWTAMRIADRWTLQDIEPHALPPAADSLQRYARELRRLKAIRQVAVRRQGAALWPVYMVLPGSPPRAPREPGKPGRREIDPDRPWRRRAWSACTRLGAAGDGFTAADVATATRVSHRRAARLLAELVDVQALGRERGQQSEYVYHLLPYPKHRVQAVLRRSDRIEGRLPWREAIWSALAGGRGLTVHDAAEIGEVSHASAYRFLAAGVDAGAVVYGALESLERTYRAAPSSGPDLPAAMMAPSARSEVARADG